MASLDKFLTDGSSGRKSTARPKSDGRREQIEAAALNVMLNEGVYGATTRKIADAASVSVASLHYHFHDRDEIIFSVMVSFVENYRSTLAEQFSETQTLADRIDVLVPFICGEIRNQPQEQMLLQEMTLFMLRHPRTENLALAKDQHFQSLYVDAFSNVCDIGAYSEEAVRRLSNLIYTTLVGMFNQWLATKDDALLEITSNDLVRSARTLALTLKTED